MIMNKKKRQETLKAMVKQANEEFFRELMKDETDANDANEGDELKAYVRRILESTEIHLPGESE